MLVVVTGGRDFDNDILIYKWLDLIDKELGITALRHGNARGVDKSCGRWALLRGKTVEVFPANWDLHGKAAGPIRNIQMLEDGDIPEYVLRFPGGKGTAHMEKEARKRNFKVIMMEIL